MKRGGKRFGAGRPKGSVAQSTLQAQALRQYIVQEVVKQKERLVAALINQGIAGEVPALREILDRTLGKVKDSMELSVPQLNPMEEIYQFVLENNKKSFIEERESQGTP